MRRSTASRSTWRQYQYETEAAALLHVRAAVVHRRDDLLRRVAGRLSSIYMLFFSTRPPGPRVDGVRAGRSILLKDKRQRRVSDMLHS